MPDRTQLWRKAHWTHKTITLHSCKPSHWGRQHVHKHQQLHGNSTRTHERLDTVEQQETYKHTETHRNSILNKQKQFKSHILFEHPREIPHFAREKKMLQIQKDMAGGQYKQKAIRQQGKFWCSWKQGKIALLCCGLTLYIRSLKETSRVT